jgi:hypothetical protein
MLTTNANTIRWWAILDLNATSHFLTTSAPATIIIPTAVPIIAHLPNGDRVHSTHTCTLDIPSLPPGARVAHIIPGLALHLLLSVVRMCNAGYTVTFSKIGCSIMYCGRTIICGHKCTRTGLWMIPLAEITTPPTSMPTTSPLLIKLAVNVDATFLAAKYARYVHQLLCSPPAATLLLALDKSTKLQTIPGLTPALICSHLPCSTATNKGHMHRHCSNTASTRNTHAAVVLASAKVDCMFPAHEVCAAQDMFCFATLTDSTTVTMYTDLTGAFPVRLFKNMIYIFIAYIYDLNAIIVRPMALHTDASCIASFTKVFTILCARDYQPALNVMDNKCSKAVEKHIHTNKMMIQLVPPHNHCVNAAKQAIRTFKEHFDAALATVVWDEFLPQIKLTLNLIPFSCRNPLISANHKLYGPFDFNKTPLAPLGTKALVYDNPATRTSWAPHATGGFYVGPATDHYRCLRFYIPATQHF